MANNKLKSKKIISSFIGAVIILIILDLTPLGGNIYYYSKWASCGQRPLGVTGSAHINGVDHYIKVPDFALLRFTAPYFCSPREAEMAGYSADPRVYDFPHLSSEESQRIIENK